MMIYKLFVCLSGLHVDVVFFLALLYVLVLKWKLIVVSTHFGMQGPHPISNFTTLPPLLSFGPLSWV